MDSGFLSTLIGAASALLGGWLAQWWSARSQTSLWLKQLHRDRLDALKDHYLEALVFVLQCENLAGLKETTNPAVMVKHQATLELFASAEVAAAYQTATREITSYAIMARDGARREAVQKVVPIQSARANLIEAMKRDLLQRESKFGRP